MVYSRIFIIHGIVLTREQVIARLELSEDLEVLNGTDMTTRFYDDIIDGYENLQGTRGLRLFSFPCCSENADKLYILGYEENCFYRKYVLCRECKDYSVCNRCIGETSRGWYDVDSIFEGPVLIPEEKICEKCHFDSVENGRCRNCNWENTRRSNQYRSKYILNFAKKMELEHDAGPGYYYMIDDCLSCT